MKYLKTISVFKFTLIFLINIFLLNKYVFAFSILYLFLEYKKRAYELILLFGVILFIANINTDYIRVGIIDEVSNKYVTVDKLFYKEKVYTNNTYQVGQIVLIKCENKSEELNELKYNICFVDYKDPKILIKNTPRSLIFDRLNSFDNNVSSNLKTIILNTYENDSSFLYLGYGFSFYYLLMMIKRKNKNLCLIILISYVIFFRFDLKFYLILSDLFLEKFKIKGVNKLSYKVLFVSIVNKYLLLNKSLMLSFIFSYIYLNDNSDKSLIMIIQSLFFNQIQLGISFIYKYYVYLRVLIFIFSLVVLIMPSVSFMYLPLLETSSFFINKISFSIRGRLNYLLIILFYIIVRKINLKNEYLKICFILLLMIPCINNPIMHINFIDVGQGDSCLIRSNFGLTNILIDTGSKYNYSKLKNELYKEGIYKLDYLIISHDDEDHSGNIDNLCEDFKVKEIVRVGKDIEDKDFYLKYLYLGDFDNANDNSLVYLLDIDNRKILFTGDISKKVENIIISKYDITNIDILKIGHHGSNTSSSSYFIGKLNPEYATISTNGKYNHPHSDTLDILNKYKIDYLITKNEGSIKFYFTKLIDLCLTSKTIELF